MRNGSGRKPAFGASRQYRRHLGHHVGKHMPEAVGADVLDGSGKAHLGIIMFPVPILRGDAEQIRAIREILYGVDYQDVIVVDFPMWPSAAKLRRIHRQCGAGGRKRMAVFRPRPLRPKKLVSRLTGSMPLLR